MLKAQAIISDTTVRRCSVDREDLKPYWNQKKATFLQVIKILLFTSFSKTLLITERRLRGP